MDVSNPVVTSERVSFEQFRQDAILLQRQNMEKLREMTRTTKRELAPILVPTMTEDKGVLSQLVRDPLLIPVGEGKVKPETKKLKTIPEIPVSKYHPQGVNQERGHVRVSRTWARMKREEEVVKALLIHCPDPVGDIRRLTYTTGTKNGFKNRIETWARTKRVSVRKTMKDWALDPQKILRQRMPVDLDQLLDLKNTEVSELLSTIHINRTSNSGPPRYQLKNECVPETMALLGDIVDAISKEDSQFFEQNGEIFVAECKNKTDRYKTDEVNTKTRPYWCFSAALSMLYSIPSQNITRALKTFDEDPDSSNAYTFSWAHGGANRLAQWMESPKEGEALFICYGDDTKLVWRENSVLFEVNPDFSQMDGSIDPDTVKETVIWIRSLYNEKHGEIGPFWEDLLIHWAEMAHSAPFLVDGEEAYEVEGGLRTGIVGTTLFDTVKSVLSYSALLQSRTPLRRPAAVVEFFKTHCGLTIKEGTWNPEPVVGFADFTEGALYTEQKFLGAQLMWQRGHAGPEQVPCIPREDLISLIGNCRANPKYSQSQKVRARFDMARGYMVTGAYLYPDVYSAMAHLINETPGEIVALRVQAGGGKGEKPEMEMMVGEDFEFPTSDGFPLPAFCRNVYLTPGNKIPGEHWVTVFPEMVEEMNRFRATKEYAQAVQTIKRGTTDWNVMRREEKAEKAKARIDAAVQAKIDAPVPEPLQQSDILGIKMPNIAKNKALVKYKKTSTPEQKKERLMRILGWNDQTEEYDVQVIHQAALKALLSAYGEHWLVDEMLNLGWVPLQSGEWSEPTQPVAEATKLTPAMVEKTPIWNYEARRAFGERWKAKTGEPDNTSEKSASSSGAPELMVRVEKIPTGKPRVLPDPSKDDASYVSSWFNTMGIVLDRKVTVLTQAPARVRVEITTRESGDLIATTVAESQKKGVAQVMAMIRAKLDSE